MDQLYYINLKKRPDRLEYLRENVLPYINIEGMQKMQVAAADHTHYSNVSQRAAGCSLSHLWVWKDAIEKGYDKIIVLEDDLELTKSEKEISEVLEKLKNVDFSICNLAYNNRTPLKETKYDFLFKCNNIQTTGCYVASVPFLKKMIPHIEEATARLMNCESYPINAIDQAWKKFQNDENWYVAGRIGKQRKSYSDIENKTVDYSGFENDNKFLKGKKKSELKLLYVAQHLSTGGMPQFILKRIEALKSTDIDVRVIELSDYGPDFVVQKNKIKAILGDKLYLADSTDKNQRILNLIEDFKPDVIHFEECPESSDRKLEPSIIEKIYSKDRTYQIVETCHNIWMTNDKKIWHPNSYMYCTPYHPLNNFKDTKSAGTVIQYPLENLIPTDQEKLDARSELGFEDNKIHVLNVGLWTKGKNQGEAVEMARRLNKIHPNKFVFHFVGNQAGNFREYWEPIMKNLPENVNVWGGRNDVDVFLKASDVFLFTSTWECNPLALKEAISHGLPTFSRNLPQYMDMYEKHIGILVDDIDINVNTFINYLNDFEPNKLIDGRLDFKNQMIEHYSKKYIAPESERNAKFRVTWNGSIKFHADLVPSDDCVIKFIENGNIVYQSNIKNNHWYSPSKKWFIPWKIEVYENNELIWDWNYEPKGNEIGIKLDSSSLGDTIAFMGQIRSFKEYWGLDKVYVFTHKNWLFDDEEYNKLGISILPWSTFSQLPTYTITLGVYYEMKHPWKKDEHKNDWRKIHLSQIASDRLGIPLDEINARPIMHPNFRNAKKPVRDKAIATFATASTAQAKYWNRDGGWQELINSMPDLHWVHCSKENHVDVNTEKSPEPLEEVAGFMLASKFFVGISSGLTWFAWALNVPTFSISGFTPEVVEKIEGITTIQNKRVCNSCWAWDVFDKGDWGWCPAHKGTERVYECSKEITVDMVINTINETI